MARPAVFPSVPAVVRQRMAQIRSTNTRPEMVVRRMLHALGYRYRLHRRDLPGTPDLVFSGRRKIIFVHGCFWHRHTCQVARRVPITRQEYWRPKLQRNVERHEASVEALERAGWKVLTVWECETKDPALMLRILVEFLTDESACAT